MHKSCCATAPLWFHWDFRHAGSAIEGGAHQQQEKTSDEAFRRVGGWVEKQRRPPVKVKTEVLLICWCIKKKVSIYIYICVVSKNNCVQYGFIILNNMYVNVCDIKHI